MIRLDKYLADMGIGTRSEVKNIIRKKQIERQWHSDKQTRNKG